jgi:streptogramin lyase
MAVTFNEYPVPADFGEGYYCVIIRGPDDNLWFTGSNGKIGMIDPRTHAVAEFPVPTESDINGITTGPDGNLWFTEDYNVPDDPVHRDHVGMINPTTHAVAEFPTHTAVSVPRGITTGPDGNLWFTEFYASQIGMINPKTDAIAEFPIPSHDEPYSITAGPDGNLWFTESDLYGRGEIGMINPTTHAVAEFPTPTVDSNPQDITAGPDGNLWFTEDYSYASVSQIGVIDPTTHAISEFPTPTADGNPQGITVGPDGNIWFTEYGPESAGGQIGMIDPKTDAITEFPFPTPNSRPRRGITTGPDGNLWFPVVVEYYIKQIGEIAFNTPTSTLTSTPTSTVASSPVAGSVALSHSKKSTTYTLTFGAPLNSASANDSGLYQALGGVARRVKKHKVTVYTKPLKIKSVSYDPGPNTVRIALAKHFKGPVQVTIKAGLEAADGAVTSSSIVLVVP